MTTPGNTIQRDTILSKFANVREMFEIDNGRSSKCPRIYFFFALINNFIILEILWNYFSIKIINRIIVPIYWSMKTRR